ncbi:MAG: cytidine deaminase [Clostridia bacterium]|nr:cytidine deaminase [Clostridia bacterium]
MIDIKEDLIIAKLARSNSRCECSRYSIGVVLNCKNGKKYSGCNIENDGIQSICGERVAFSKAISEGEKEFDSILVIGGKKDSSNLEKCLPCGYCRQFMSQFVEKDFKIYTAFDNKVEEYTMEELLPYQFHL